MGVGRAPPGTVAQQRTTEHGVAAPAPMVHEDGAVRTHDDAMRVRIPPVRAPSLNCGSSVYGLSVHGRPRAAPASRGRPSTDKPSTDAPLFSAPHTHHTRPQEAEPCSISRSTSRLASCPPSRRRPRRDAAGPSPGASREPRAPHDHLSHRHDIAAGPRPSAVSRQRTEGRTEKVGGHLVRCDERDHRAMDVAISTFCHSMRPISMTGCS